MSHFETGYARAMRAAGLEKTARLPDMSTLVGLGAFAGAVPGVMSEEGSMGHAVGGALLGAAGGAGAHRALRAGLPALKNWSRRGAKDVVAPPTGDVMRGTTRDAAPERYRVAYTQFDDRYADGAIRPKDQLTQARYYNVYEPDELDNIVNKHSLKSRSTMSDEDLHPADMNMWIVEMAGEKPATGRHSLARQLQRLSDEGKLKHIDTRRIPSSVRVQDLGLKR